MSAYGAITRSAAGGVVLPPTVWNSNKTHVTTFHLTLATATAHSGLVAYLHECFAEELERGNTYPQEILENEEYTQTMFEAYYFAADVIVAIAGEVEDISSSKSDGDSIPDLDIESARHSRTWEACVAGCYYVSFCLCSRSLQAMNLHPPFR